MAESSRSWNEFEAMSATSGDMKEKLDFLLQLAKKCVDEVHGLPSQKFNNEQCSYLVSKLEVAVEIASLFLEWSQVRSRRPYITMHIARQAKNLEHLVALAKEIESFVQCCSRDTWMESALTLVHAAKYVSSLGFNLELCKIAFGCGETTPRSLTCDEVCKINEDEVEIVVKKALIDKSILLKNVTFELNSSDPENCSLAKHLVHQLVEVQPKPTSDKDNVLLRLYKWVVSGKKAKQLGRGSSATVHEVKWFGIPAAKKTFMGPENEDFLREVEILSQLRHPNITSMFCCHMNKWSCSIIMELMDGDLRNMMLDRQSERNNDAPPFTILEGVDLMLQVGEGVNYLHDQRIVHRDLKSSNILVKNVEVSGSGLGYVHAKVVDFGLSKTKEKSTYSIMTYNTGTYRWMAPEVIINIEDHGESFEASEKLEKHVFKVDIYSFAMVCFEILTGELPFISAPSTKRVKQMVLKGERPKIPDYCPQILKTLIEKCWSQIPSERPCISDVCLQLKYIKYLLMTESSRSWNEFEAMSATSVMPASCSSPRFSAHFGDASSQYSDFDADTDHFERESGKAEKLESSRESPVHNDENHNSGCVTPKVVDSDNLETLQPEDLEQKYKSIRKLAKQLRIQLAALHGGSSGTLLSSAEEHRSVPPNAVHEETISQSHIRDDLSTASEAFPAKSLTSQGEGSSTSAIVSVTPEHSTLPIIDSITPNDISRWTVIDETKRREKEEREKLSVSFQRLDIEVEDVWTPSSGDSDTDSSGDSDIDVLRGTDLVFSTVSLKVPNWSTWVRGEFLGRGTFGTMYKCIGSNGMFLAVKEVSLVDKGKAGKQAIMQLEHEIVLLSDIQHPNIVQYLGTERDDKNLYIFLELVDEGSLAQLYEKYELFYAQVREYTKQILVGLKHLHDRKIIHRNLKCANILVTASGTELKLAEFGLAKQTDKLGLLESFLGSAHWIAPEVVNPRRSYDLKADIWSLGCTLLEMATGKPPYGEDMETHGVLWKVGNGEAPPIPEEFEEDLKDFIRNCLEVNAVNRPTCDLLLAHPFITGESMTDPVKLVPTPELMPSIAEEWY